MDIQRSSKYSADGKILPILPTGMVNLKTRKCAQWGYINFLWDDENDVYVLVKRDGKFKAIITSDVMSHAQVYFPIGGTLGLQHDQTGRDLGSWKIVGLFQNDAQGFDEMRKATGKNAIAFACFK